MANGRANCGLLHLPSRADQLAVRPLRNELPCEPNDATCWGVIAYGSRAGSFHQEVLCRCTTQAQAVKTMLDFRRCLR